MASVGMDPSNAAVVAANAARLAQLQSIVQEQAPVCLRTSTGIHVNVAQGTINTETRGVFISSIDYKASSKDIAQHFSKAGELVDCQLQKDLANGRSKGKAIVQYTTAENANKAVQMFHNRTWMSMRLIVRLDKNSVAVSTPSVLPSRISNRNSVQQSGGNIGPVIVNGSICLK
jgi:RNA recognition motif-containing protein